MWKPRLGYEDHPRVLYATKGSVVEAEPPTLRFNWRALKSKPRPSTGYLTLAGGWTS